MNTAGIKSLLADSIAAARFRLFIKAIEHTAKVEPVITGKAQDRRRRPKQRYQTGSWVVSMSGGFIRYQAPPVMANVEGSQSSQHPAVALINDAISKILDDLFEPVLRKSADRFGSDPTLENLIRFEHIFRNYEDAKNIRVDQDANGLVPAGNGSARFDVEDWEDGDAEGKAKAFMQSVNEVIESSTRSIVSNLNNRLVKAVSGG